MGLALSTSWNAFRYTQGEKLILEIKALGFTEVELSFNLTLAMVEGIAKLVKSRTIQVVSLHNFCPIPDGLRREEALPDYYSLASLSEEARQLALRQTKKTIDTAEELEAKAVVLHIGRVEVPDRTRQLIGLYQNGLSGSGEFIRLRNEIIQEREEAVKPFFANALKSLDELNRYAIKKSISLGIETRFYFREIPALEELGVILSKFEGGNLFYWHDTGHAQVMECLGFNSHKAYLDLYAKNLLGVHLHNLSKCDDHQAPSNGELDFKWLKPYLKKDTLKVIEAHHPATPEEIKASKELLEKIFNGAL